MWESSPTLVTEAAEFTEMIGSLWGFATLASRSRGKLPVLAPSQARALRIVIANDAITPTELAEQMQMSRSLVSEVIRKLEDSDLVARRRSREDGRSVTITPTERGTYVQQHFRLGLVDAVAEAFGEMPHAEVQRIMETLPSLERLHQQLSTIAEREEAASTRRKRAGPGAS